MPEQVQDFYPTPSTMSTCMYYTGVDPRTMKPVYVPHSAHEKALQRALIQYRKPENYDLVREALERAGRSDLIGYGPKCLIRPVRPHGQKTGKHAGSKRPAAGNGRQPSGDRHDSAHGAHGARPAEGSRSSRASKHAQGGKRGANTAGRNRAGQGREANRGGHRG